MSIEAIYERREVRKKRRMRKRRMLLAFFMTICAAAGLVMMFQHSETSEPIFLDTGDTVYYSQRDRRWKDELYGSEGTIGEAGCGPTCLAMAASTLTDNSVTPVDTAKWAADNGQRCIGSGSYHSIIPEGGKEYGFRVDGADKQHADEVKQALEDGELVIALMSRGHFTVSGHFILLRGFDEEGKVLVSDPNSRRRSAKSWDFDLILKEAKNGAANGGPFWICHKQAV